MSGEGHSNNREARAKLGLVTHDNTGGYFVVECQGCGLVYPSFQCEGGEAIGDSGDYSDAVCPHCNQVDPEECDNVGLVWNTQQLKINALQELLNQRDEQNHSLEQRRYAELENGQAAERRVEVLEGLLRGTFETAAKWVDKRCDDYVNEHGASDPETGTVEFPGDGEEYVGELMEIAEGIRGLAHQSTPAEQPAPVAVVLPERSNQDYAIEHAEYMAKSADHVLEAFQAYGLALLAVDEGGDDGEGEQFEAIDSARSDLQESLIDLRGMVYEFRKRSARTAPL